MGIINLTKSHPALLKGITLNLIVIKEEEEKMYKKNHLKSNLIIESEHRDMIKKIFLFFNVE